MTLGAILVAALIALVAGGVVYLIGRLFDKTPDNRYAGIAALVVAVLAFVAQTGLANLG